MVGRKAIAGFVLVSLLSSSRAAGARSKYEADLAAFFQEIDGSYPFFDLKGIREDWERAKADLSHRTESCRSDEAFVGIVLDAMKCLRDAHAGLRKTNVRPPPPPPRHYPGVSFLPATKRRVVIMTARKELASHLKAGTVVTRIDGKNARQFLEERASESWEAGGWFSSPQRACLFEYRIPLRGKKGERHTLSFISRAGTRRIALTCDLEARGWPHTYNLPRDLTREGRSSFHAKLPSGAGYLYLRRIDQSTEPGIRAALRAHPDARGWIVDLRGNGGGGYGRSLLDLLKTLPRPVAVLLDAGCVSAGETLARDLVRLAGARLFGASTAGSSTSKRAWTFPSGIATLTLSVRSRFGLGRKPIEFNGIEPHEQVEAVPEELQRGLNSAILRAEEYVAKAR